MPVLFVFAYDPYLLKLGTVYAHAHFNPRAPTDGVALKPFPSPHFPRNSECGVPRRGDADFALLNIYCDLSGYSYSKRRKT